MLSIKWFLTLFHRPVESFFFLILVIQGIVELLLIFDSEFSYILMLHIGRNFSLHSLVLTTLNHRTVSRQKFGVIIVLFSALFVGQVLVLKNTIKTSDTQNLRFSILS